MAEITAQTADGAVQIKFDYEFGETLEDAVKLFGEKVVHSYVIRSLTIAAQGAARGMMKSGKSKEEILAAMATWKPGEPRQTTSPEEKIRSLVNKMSPEDRARLAAELRAEQNTAATKKGKAA